MKKIAVIGLGIMGHGIADNFLKNGYEIVLWNRDETKAQDLPRLALAAITGSQIPRCFPSFLQVKLYARCFCLCLGKSSSSRHNPFSHRAGHR